MLKILNFVISIISYVIIMLYTFFVSIILSICLMFIKNKEHLENNIIYQHTRYLKVKLYKIKKVIMNLFDKFLHMNLLACLFILIVVLFYWAAISFIIMCLWNWLIPLFWTSAPILTFFQTAGIL